MIPTHSLKTANMDESTKLETAAGRLVSMLRSSYYCFFVSRGPSTIPYDTIQYATCALRCLMQHLMRSDSHASIAIEHASFVEYIPIALSLFEHSLVHSLQQYDLSAPVQLIISYTVQSVGM
jgi:hypothetical protein